MESGVLVIQQPSLCRSIAIDYSKPVPTENSIGLIKRASTRAGTSSSVSESTCRIAEL
jgi:hypothetical protein